MPVHISDSAVCRNSWATPELLALFDDAALTADWIEAMVALAEMEAEFALIPAEPVARQLADACRVADLDEVFFAEVPAQLVGIYTDCEGYLSRRELTMRAIKIIAFHPLTLTLFR